MKKQTYTINEAVRGEMRLSDEVLTYNLEPGPAPADIDQRILERLIRDGIAVETKKETAR